MYFDRYTRNKTAPVRVWKGFVENVERLEDAISGRQEEKRKSSRTGRPMQAKERARWTSAKMSTYW